MNKTVGWGLLGLGNIAARFSAGLSLVPEARLAAVGARKAQRADAFAAQWRADAAFGHYKALVRHPAVDIVYIGTPHSFHMDQALLAMDAGKHVLVEKPAAVCAGQMRSMIAKAEEKNVFLMEAMWTRFFPVTKKVREWLAEGRIGKAVQLQGAFSFAARGLPKTHRLMNPALAGGALLDVGVYLLSYADMVYGTAPDKVLADAQISPQGVDLMTNILLRYPCGGRAVFSCGFNAAQKDTMMIYGETGSIEIPQFWSPRRAVLTCGAERTVYSSDHKGEGFQFEIEHVHDCLRKGKRQSPLMPWESTLRVLELCEQIAGVPVL